MLVAILLLVCERKTTLLQTRGGAENFRLFGHDGLSDLRPFRIRKQHLRRNHESTALALTSPRLEARAVCARLMLDQLFARSRLTAAAYPG